MINKKIIQDLLKKANVVSVGWGYKYKNGKRTNGIAICVGVEKKVSLSTLATKDFIPQMISGMLTDVWETGKFKIPQLKPQEFNQRYRPAPGGVSIGHPSITAGTLGCICYREDQPMILSNNHVMAASNTAKIGDPIYQPGVYDGGKPEDEIAKLYDFVEVKFQGIPEIPCTGSKYLKKLLDLLLTIIRSSYRVTFYRRAEENTNLVDAALATANPTLVINEILKIGTIRGVLEGSLGMAIQKSGRTTEYTTGEILQVGVTVQVQYGENQIATFEDQLMAGNMCAGGDSGSAILDTERNIVGLLFAGSDTQTIMCRIQNVAELLKIERFA